MKKIKSQKRLYSIRKKRIGVLGGTFDPPHLAHIHMADTAKKAHNLDKVIFMPLGVPPHGKTGVSSAEHRINMLKIILKDKRSYYIDIFEVESDIPSYTVNSSERINNILGDGSEVFFIIGADSLMYLEKWYDAKKLFGITDFIVIPRGGYSKEECLEHIDLLSREYGARISYIDAKELDYSSTELRQNPNDEDLNITTKDVMEYIKVNRLYVDK